MNETNQPYHCPNCHYKIYDGEVIKSRITKPTTPMQALCRCKQMITLPFNATPTTKQ